MLKKINIIIVMFFLPLSIKINLGYMLFLPITLFYLVKDNKNVFYTAIPSIISMLIFSREYFINYLVVLILTILLYYIIEYFMNKEDKVMSLYDLIILTYILLVNMVEKVFLKVGPVNTLGFIIGTVSSLLIYIYLQHCLSKMLKEEYENTNHLSSSLCYLDIMICIITIISSTAVSFFDVNFGFILGIYFAMFTGRSYKNIYAIFYSLCTMLILLIGYDISISLFIPFICALYFINNIYLMVILNIFLTILLFTNQPYDNHYIMSVMATSVIFEILSRFLIKDLPTDKDIFEEIHSQIQKNTSEEILNFAVFLDKFAVGFKNPKEFNEQLSNGIKTIVQTHCKNCSKTKECFNKYKVELYPIFKTILLGEEKKEEIKKFYEYCPKAYSMEKTSKLLGRKQYESSAHNDALIAQINGFSSSIRKYVIDLTSKQEMSYYQILLMKKRLLDYGLEVTYFEIKRYFYKDFLILVGIKDKTLNEINDIISTMAEKTLNQKVSIVLQNIERSTTYINIIPKIKIDVVYGYGSISSDGVDICGDNYMIKEFDNGHFISAISDGMGKGYSAFYESDMTLKLIADIIELNLDYSTALEILNTYYVVQDYLERYATLDFLEINRYTSVAHFYKMGATTTYIFKKNGTIDRIINKSLPFGIEEEIDNSEYILDEDDLVLMSSDGIFENLIDSDKLESFIEEIKEYPPQKIVYEILNYAINNKVKTKDDMSVIALKIKSA